MNERPTHIDLFSGIGGFSIAAERAGFETVCFVERDKDRQQILENFWPEVPIYSDICNFSGRPYRGANLLTGGFPCQPFSTAGKRRGEADDRYLWREMLRVIQTTKPDWIVGENVTGLDGLGLDKCISDLEASSYEVAPPLEIPACALGAPHGRPRIWIIANTINDGGAFVQPARRRERRAGEASEGGITADADSLRKLQSKRRESYERRRALYVSHEAQWAESWSDRLSALCGMDDGISRRLHEAKAPGNAIVPQVAFQILKAIYEIERG